MGTDRATGWLKVSVVKVMGSLTFSGRVRDIQLHWLRGCGLGGNNGLLWW
jgi:hypothetical protein